MRRQHRAITRQGRGPYNHSDLVRGREEPEKSRTSVKSAQHRSGLMSRVFGSPSENTVHLESRAHRSFKAARLLKSGPNGHVRWGLEVGVQPDKVEAELLHQRQPLAVEGCIHWRRLGGIGEIIARAHLPRTDGVPHEHAGGKTQI